MLPRGTAGPVVPVLVAVLLTCLLAGCSSGGGPAPDTTGQAREALRATFTGYTQALLRRDFASACAALTDDAKNAFVADLNSKNIPATSCEVAYGALYATDAAPTLDEQGRSVRVLDVAVDGASGTITYTGTVKGRAVPPQTVRAQRAGDAWQLAPSR